MIPGFEVLKMAEPAIPLDQPETARVPADETADLKTARIVQRAPYALTGPGMDSKPERIVDRGAVIRPGCRVERPEHEHRGQRAQPDMGERFARKQRQIDIDIDNGRGTGVNIKPVCAGNPRAVE